MLKLVYSYFGMGIVRMNLFNRKSGYTLTEVMLTITLIGFLSTLTLSTVGSSIQQRKRLAEFRTAYAKLSTALKSVTSDTAKVHSCYLPPTAAEVTNLGLRIDGNTAAASFGCQDLERSFVRAMGAVRFCENNPLTEGCLPTNYPKAASGCFQNYSGSKAYVLDNSMIVFTDTKNNSLRLFAIDTNGRQGPNKWGQDIFPFSVKYTETKTVNGKVFVKAIDILPPNESGCTYATSKAARTTTRLMKESAGIKVESD